MPAPVYFSTPDLRTGVHATNVLVYGPPHLFRACWMAGARDYLREPWTADELYLRVRGPGPSAIEWAVPGGLCRLDGRCLSRGGDSVVLTTTEASLLRVLVQRRGTPVSRSILAWSAGCSPGRVVDTLVARVRKGLKRLGLDDHGPAAVRGLGYRLP